MDPMSLMLFGLLAVMLVFMFVNTRKRQRQMKAEQEEKATKTVPGAKVLLQGGLYGTVVEYDPQDLDKPARIELAPGAVVEVHSQAILRIVEPTVPAEDAVADASDEVSVDEMPDPNHIETPEETRARLERNGDAN